MALVSLPTQISGHSRRWGGLATAWCFDWGKYSNYWRMRRNVQWMNGMGRVHQGRNRAAKR